MRARDVGIIIGQGQPGPLNAITDVAGVEVGHTTLIHGDGPVVVGQGPVRTGVTVIKPRSGSTREDPVFAGAHALNGNGELTGLLPLREYGLLNMPIGLTNTHSVGVVRDALIAAEVPEHDDQDRYWRLPVAGETWDGRLNDINGMHVRTEHVEAALRSARGGPVEEGNVGGGTGMVCHGFKGGIGTASRAIEANTETWTLGVLVQANYGRRERLLVNGVPVGRIIDETIVPVPYTDVPHAQSHWRAGGSIIVVVATDAPLLPHQCQRVAQRAGLGLGRIGGVGEHYSGDIFIAFATGNRDVPTGDFGDQGMPVTSSLTTVNHGYIDLLFDATVEATEEAIVNALTGAETMTGADGVTAHGIGAERLRDVLAEHDALTQ